MNKGDYYYFLRRNRTTAKLEIRKCQLVFATPSQKNEAVVRVFDKRGNNPLRTLDWVDYKDLYTSEAEIKMVYALKGVFL